MSPTDFMLSPMSMRLLRGNKKKVLVRYVIPAVSALTSTLPKTNRLRISDCFLTNSNHYSAKAMELPEQSGFEALPADLPSVREDKENDGEKLHEASK